MPSPGSREWRRRIRPLLHTRASERHKGYPTQVIRFQVGALFDKFPQGLKASRRPDGNYQAASLSKLLDERRRKVVRGRGEEDGVKWLRLRPAIISIPLPGVQSAVTQCL